MTEGYKITIFVPEKVDEVLGQLQHAERYHKNTGHKKIREDVVEYTLYDQRDYVYFLSTLCYFLRIYPWIEIKNAMGESVSYHEHKPEAGGAHTSHGHGQSPEVPQN